MAMTDPEKLRALVEKWRKPYTSKTWEPVVDAENDARARCADELSALLAEAERPTPMEIAQDWNTRLLGVSVSDERPTPPVEEIDYRFLYRSAEAECIRWRRRAERLGYTVEGEHKSVTPPVEDAVTRAKLEMLDKVKTAIIAIPEGESDPVLIWMSVHLTIDALRAHLKGSPE
jgi:hypothetical protein